MTAQPPAKGTRGYVYPLDDTATQGRVDQGVDYGGTGNIYAIGDGVVISAGAGDAGWPGSGVTYQLTSGPRAGQFVAVREGMTPSVRVGQRIAAGQKIGTMIPGSSSGIEILFTTASGTPITPYAGRPDGTPMPGGYEMRAFLGQLASGQLKPTNAIGAAGHAVGIVGDAVGNAALDTAKAIVGLLFDAFGKDGARILVYLVLVLGGGGLALYGVARAFGIGAKLPSPPRLVAT